MYMFHIANTSLLPDSYAFPFILTHREIPLSLYLGTSVKDVFRYLDNLILSLVSILRHSPQMHDSIQYCMPVMGSYRPPCHTQWMCLRVFRHGNRHSKTTQSPRLERSRSSFDPTSRTVKRGFGRWLEATIENFSPQLNRSSPLTCRQRTSSLVFQILVSAANLPQYSPSHLPRPTAVATSLNCVFSNAVSMRPMACLLKGSCYLPPNWSSLEAY